MIPPHGWQNLSPNRHRSYRDTIPAEIRQVYPEAVERQVNNEFLTYWAAERLVGIAWMDNRQRWFYTIMPRMAFEMKVNCSLFPLPENRFRILPLRPEDSPEIQRHIHETDIRSNGRRRAHSRRKQHNRLQTFLYQENDHWYVEFERNGRTQKFGPYQSFDAANYEVPALIKQVRQYISAVG